MKYQFPMISERLEFMPLTMDDVADWADFFIDNPGLKYLAIDNPDTPEKEAIIWIERQLKRYEEMGWGHLKLVNKKTGLLVGNAGLILREEEGKELLEIGYSILPAYWGKGYASEAAMYLKEYMKLHKLGPKAISMIHADNIGSQKVAERNGMKRGRTSEYMGMPIYIYEVTF